MGDRIGVPLPDAWAEAQANGRPWDAEIDNDVLDLGARPEVQRLFQLKSALIKMFCKHRVVKPDQDRLADFQGWGSKVAGWAEHGSLGLIT